MPRGSKQKVDLSLFPPDITRHYDVGEEVGKGAYGQVNVAKHILTGEKVAIKTMDKANLTEREDLHRASLEIQALKELRHKYVIRLYQVLETDSHIFLVFEYAPNGDLCDYLDETDICPNNEAKRIFKQIALAVSYTHKMGYAIRDLKLENVMLDKEENVRLIDFGLVSHPEDVRKTMLRTCCGSRTFAAPEVVNCLPYRGDLADIWSMGVLLFTLLSGEVPYESDNGPLEHRQMQRAQFQHYPWMHPQALDLLAKILKYEPAARPSIDQILEHPWLKDIETPSLESLLDPLTLNLDAVVALSRYYGVDMQTISTYLGDLRYDHVTAEYELCCARLTQGKSLKLPQSKGVLPVHSRGGSARNTLTKKVSSPALGETTLAVPEPAAILRLGSDLSQHKSDIDV